MSEYTRKPLSPSRQKARQRAGEPNPSLLTEGQKDWRERVGIVDLERQLKEAQGKLEALVKATQPMDFCHVCLSVHSNFKDASDHKEWCAWDKADSFLRGSKEDE